MQAGSCKSREGRGWPPAVPDWLWIKGVDWPQSAILPGVFMNCFFWPVKKQVQVWMAGNKVDEAEHCMKRGPSQ